MHYHGTLIDGSVFDSSITRGDPISFPLDGVIKGWAEGLQLMRVSTLLSSEGRECSVSRYTCRAIVFSLFVSLRHVGVQDVFFISGVPPVLLVNSLCQLCL